MIDPVGTRAITAWLEGLAAEYEDGPSQTFTYGPAPEHLVEHWPAPGVPGGGPVVVSIHGGAFMSHTDLTTHHPVCARIQAEGFDVYNIEYRRTGSVSDPRETIGDALAAVTEVVSRCGSEVAVVGHSAGGYLAERIAELPGASLVLALAPLTDLWAWATDTEPERLLAWLGPGGGEATARELSLDPARSVSADRVIIHGTADQVVPFEESRAYVDQVRSEGGDVDLIRLDGEGHFAFLDPAESAFNEVMAALQAWRLKIGSND